MGAPCGCPDVYANLDIVVNTDNTASAHALGSFTITICNKPWAYLIFVDSLSRAHASPAALELVASYCVSHNVAQIRVTHDANDILSLSL